MTWERRAARGARTAVRFVLPMAALLLSVGAFLTRGPRPGDEPVVRSPALATNLAALTRAAPDLGDAVQLPTMVTNASGPVTVGATIRDTAVLSGGAAPTGSISFQLYGPGDPSCTGAVLSTSTAAVTGDGSYQSAAFAPNRLGLYEWMSSYSGDAGNAPVPGICPAAGESSFVLIAIPALTTVAPTSATTGAPLTDQVVLSGGSNPTGQLTFTVFGPNDASCSGPPADTFPAVTVAGNGTYSSGPFTPTAPGTYGFEVGYSGDANNLAQHTPCGITSQSTAVTAAAPTITGVAPVPASVGGSIVGSEVFSGGNHPTGTVIFVFYGPNDRTCSRTPAFTSRPTIVTGDGTYTSPPFTPTAPGSYNIVARYSGDANNAATTTPCGGAGQTVSVSRAIPTIVAQSALSTVVGQSISTAESISAGLNPTGTIVFSFYRPADSTCTSQPLLVSPRIRVTGNGTYHSPLFTPTDVGDYRFVVAYSGDSKNIPLTTDCNAINQALLVSVSTLYDPAQHPKAVINLEVVAFALLALAGPAGASRAALQARPSQPGGTRTGKGAAQQSSSQGSVVSTAVDNTSEGWEAVAVLGAEVVEKLGKNAGDLSRSWHWPGTARVDKLSAKVPEKVAPASPLAARITNDAGYLRAMFGSASAFFPIAAAVLAVVAVADVHGHALPPPFLVAMALAVLGVFDALAGFIGVAVFVGGIIALGGLSTGNDARTLLGLSSLWFAAPIIAGAARPLRREPTRSTAEHAERIADVVVVALAGAWAVKEILSGLPGLSGMALPIADHANAAALIVLAALGIRMAAETIAAHHYPLRLAEVQAEQLPVSGRAQHIASAIFALTVFLFIALPYVGPSWQLYVGGAFFAVPILLKIYSDYLPNLPKLYAALPRGILQTVTMLVIGTAFGAFVAEQITGSNHHQVIRESFLLLSLPGLALALLQQFGRDGPEAPKIHWLPEKILGGCLIVLGAMVAVGTLKI